MMMMTKASVRRGRHIKKGKTNRPAHYYERPND
jgi:hypothetical protein